MPVEESANMILMVRGLLRGGERKLLKIFLKVAAITKQTGSFPQELEKYLPILKQWALYLQSTLPGVTSFLLLCFFTSVLLQDPGNQLCTDDFTVSATICFAV